MVRVSQAAPAAAAPAVRRPAGPEGGEASPERRAAFELKREGVREMLAVMTDMDPSLAVLGPEGVLGSASVWVANAPLARRAQRAARERPGSSSGSKKARRWCGAPAQPRRPRYPVAATGASHAQARARRVRPGPARISISSESPPPARGLRAFAYSPTGRLHAYRPGDKLADGTVRAVNATDVELETDEGRIRAAVAAALR